MQDPLSMKFAALADPTRRAMLEQLLDGQATVSEIAEPFLERMSLPAITKHLQVLERAGFITKTQDAQRRLCRLELEAFGETSKFLDGYRQMWEERFDRLDAHLKKVVQATDESKPKKSKKSKKGE